MITQFFLVDFYTELQSFYLIARFKEVMVIFWQIVQELRKVTKERKLWRNWIPIHADVVIDKRIMDVDWNRQDEQVKKQERIWSYF